MPDRDISERMAVAERDIEALQNGETKIWETMDRIKDALSNIRAQIAGTIAVVSILQTIALGWLIWKLTG